MTRNLIDRITGARRKQISESIKKSRNTPNRYSYLYVTYEKLAVNECHNNKNSTTNENFLPEKKRLF
jgi:hypothetical protein